MANIVTLGGETVFGNQRVLYGTYAKDSGDTTGTLTLKLNAVTSIMACSSTAAVAVAGSWSTPTLTITGTTGDTGGYWMVYGY